MKKKGDFTFDHKRTLLNKVTDVRGPTVIIERVFSPSDILPDLYSFERPGLISLD